MDDLRDGIIRTPLSPLITFRDDPLRVLRAIRFAARFGFTLHEVGPGYDAFSFPPREPYGVPSWSCSYYSGESWISRAALWDKPYLSPRLVPMPHDRH